MRGPQEGRSCEGPGEEVLRQVQEVMRNDNSHFRRRRSGKPAATVKTNKTIKTTKLNDMSTIYEKELSLSKQDFIKSGGAMSQWRNMEKMSSITLRDCGFASGYEVRRLADRYGSRKA